MCILDARYLFNPVDSRNVTSYQETQLSKNSTSQLFNQRVHSPNVLKMASYEITYQKKPSKATNILSRLLKRIHPFSLCAEPKYLARLKEVIENTPSELREYFEISPKIKHAEIKFVIECIKIGEINLEDIFPHAGNLALKLENADDTEAISLFTQALTEHRQIYQKRLESIDILEALLSQKTINHLLDLNSIEQILIDHRFIFTKEALSSLPKERILSLTSLIYAFQENLPQKQVEDYIEFLPNYAKAYLEILQNSEEIVSSVSKIQILTNSLLSADALKPQEKEDFFYGAIAHLVNVKKEPLNIFLKTNLLDRAQLLNLAPFLRYADLRNIYQDDTPQFENTLIKKAINLHFLFINGPTIVSLPILKNLIFLECINCNNLENIPSLPRCRYVNCNGCFRLKTIHSLPFCESLRCKICFSLKYIKGLPACQYLNYKYSNQIKELPPLPSIRILKRSCNTIDPSPEIALRLALIDNDKAFLQTK